MAADLLTEETALELASEIVGKSSWILKPLSANLLRTQKVAYLLGQIAAMDGMHEKRLTQFEQSRLRELRAELAAMEEQ